MANLSIHPANASTQSPDMLNDLSELQWQNRIIVINNINHDQQILKLLEQRQAELLERDIMWFFLSSGEIISNYPHSIAADFAINVRNKYQLKEQQVILIGKDGGLKSRFNELELTAIFSEIDAMPMRQAEMRKKQ